MQLKDMVVTRTTRCARAYRLQRKDRKVPRNFSHHWSTRGILAPTSAFRAIVSLMTLRSTAMSSNVILSAVQRAGEIYVVILTRQAAEGRCKATLPVPRGSTFHTAEVGRVFGPSDVRCTSLFGPSGSGTGMTKQANGKICRQRKLI